MKFNFYKLFAYILITFFIGSFFVIFGVDTNIYASINKPFNFPGVIFPIVWGILYFIMGVTVYIISMSNNPNKETAINIYFKQLFVNSLWTLIFFALNLYLLAFLWILLLVGLVIIMIMKFVNINKLAGLLNILYLLWLLFAAYINLSIVLLN